MRTHSFRLLVEFHVIPFTKYTLFVTLSFERTCPFHFYLRESYKTLMCSFSCWSFIVRQNFWKIEVWFKRFLSFFSIQVRCFHFFILKTNFANKRTNCYFIHKIHLCGIYVKRVALIQCHLPPYHVLLLNAFVKCTKLLRNSK